MMGIVADKSQRPLTFRPLLLWPKVSILSSFESRLMQLENSIIPVHKQTENLQRLQENVDRTLSCMDHVISYYHVAKDTDRIIREGWDVRPSAELLFVGWKVTFFFPLDRPDDWTSTWLVLQRFKRPWNTFRTTTQTAPNSTQWYSLVQTQIVTF